MTDRTVNALKGILSFAYTTFEDSVNLAKNLETIEHPVTVQELSQILTGKKKTGWFGLKVASMRRWGLVSSNGKMKLTKRYKKFISLQDPTSAAEIKREAFMEIPLFKEIFDKYSSTGDIPIEEQLAQILESEYKISPTYSSCVAGVIRKSVRSYFPNYGNTTFQKFDKENQEKPALVTPRAPDTYDHFEMNIAYPGGGLRLEAKTKKEFDDLVKNKLSKIWETIHLLWKETKPEAAAQEGKNDN